MLCMMHGSVEGCVFSLFLFKRFKMLPFCLTFLLCAKFNLLHRCQIIVLREKSKIPEMLHLKSQAVIPDQCQSCEPVRSCFALSNVNLS